MTQNSRPTLKQIMDNLENKTYSSYEITQEYLNKIEKHDDLNSYIHVNKDLALEKANEADKARGNAKKEGKKLSPLTGVPIAQKDIFCTTDMPTTCGSKMLENFVSPVDAHIVQKYNYHVLINFGKVNMDEFAMGSTNENSFFGAVKNPWNKTCTPGGSSGVSAAVVAAGLAPAATGTDTGGSIRQPAAFCGITGLKPTYGRVSRFGMVAFASSLDQGGPMAQTAEDAAILLNVMAGHDKRDTTCANVPTEDYTASLNQDLKGLKIGIPKDFFNENLNPKISQTVLDAIKSFEKMGSECVEIELPHNSYSLHVYYIIAPAEASANLSRFDGIRYGYRCDDPHDLNDLHERTRMEGFGMEVKRRIMMGTYALSSGYYDAYYLKAQKCEDSLAKIFKKHLLKWMLLWGLLLQLLLLSLINLFQIRLKCI